VSDEWWEPADRALLEAVDGALARAAHRAGAHLVCRPGCTDCCIGPFAITRLDALRLRRGLERLAAADPERAAAVVVRARAAWHEIGDGFPGDPSTGRLGDDDDAEAAFVERHAGEPCPALDPASGRCDLYAHRPLVCRFFGPPVRLGGEGFPPCRLCFVTAGPAEVEACRVEPDPEGLEEALLDRLEAERGPGWETVVAFVLGYCGLAATAGTSTRSPVARFATEE